jgi:benzoate-CoA ligase family protein
VIDLPREFNVAAHFVDRNVAEGRGDRVAHVCGKREITYADLLTLTNKAGNALQALGVEMENRVLMVCVDAPEFLATFWGAIKIGAIPVPLNTLLKTADYEYLLNDSRAKVAVVSGACLPEVGPALAKARSLRHVLVAGGDPGAHRSWEAEVEQAPAELAPAPTCCDDAAVWLYSSGSTGFPKGTVHLQHDMVVCAEAYAKGVLVLRADDRIYSFAKLFFAYGLGNASFFPAAVGAQSFLYPARPTPQSVFEVVTSYRPTVLFAVPTMYAGMLALEGAEKKYDLSSLRLCISAGESLPPELYHRWQERFGLEILDGIGSTEMLHIFLSNRPGESRPGVTGVPVPGYDAMIVDDDGSPVPRGEIGNLRVRGDSSMALYWNQHEKTKRAIQGEWVLTGDKYVQDDAGFFSYCGRADDMLKVGGIWVSPVEIEATLIEHPAVLEVGVVGAEDAEKLVKPKAFVVLKDPAKASEELAGELKAFVKDRIAPYKFPRWIEFVSELPKTATGKIQRYRLRS